MFIDQVKVEVKTTIFIKELKNIKIYLRFVKFSQLILQILYFTLFQIVSDTVSRSKKKKKLRIP